MASADSTSAEFEDSDVIEIISAEEYDSHRAKLRASISWILTKAYGVNIPPQIKEPFYENAKGQLQLKPQLVNLLVSSDLYCQACSNMFTDTSSQWQGHWSIIQVLSRKGIYVTESAEAVVTETVLMQTAPFKVAAHMALIDALMKAYASEIASVERVVQAVRRYASFNASSELPCGTEEALMFWVNKTCTALASRGDLESEIIQGESSQKVRIISKSTPREPRSVPKMEELLRDVGDGCCLAAVIAFYQPDSFPLKEVCLKESLGIADSLYNLRLIRTYCERHLVLKCFHFTYEDLLYARDNLHPNMLVFVAELFFLLEAMQDHGSSPAGHKEGAGEGVGQVGGRRLPSPSMPQISSATKRSFQKAAAEEGRHQTEKFGTSPSSLSSRQPLLPRRTPGRRSNSLSSPQERDTVRRSVLAWQDDQDLKERKSQASTLLENVSMSWEADTTDPELEAVTSVDLAEFESNGPHLVDPHHPDYMELVSVTPGSPRSTPRSMLAERLMPATLRPAKEKANNHSKAEERGDRAVRKKPATSPTTPKASGKGKLSPPGSVVRGRTSPGGGTGSVGSGGGEGGLQQRSSGSSSSMDETIVTPLASADLLTARSGGDSSPVPSQREVQSGQSVTVSARVPPSEAFMVQPDAADLPLQLPHSPRRTVSGAGVQGDRSTPTTSYTLESTIHDARSARDAGLPVIGRSASDLPPDVEVGVRLGGAVGASREGSVASSRSSGDYSDHESHKIHQDHKARESLKHSPRRLGDVGETGALLQPHVDGSKPGPLIMDQLPDGGKKPGTTSFAELRRMKEGLGNVDNSGYIYMQHGMEPSQGGGSDPQRVGPGGAVVKKATLGQLPNATTWRQSAQRTAAGAASPIGSSNGGGGSDDSSLNPSQAQFSQLKLKLEEKRREIERNKQRQEMATAKMRQRMGKLAFMRVISKQDDSSAGIVSALSTQPALLGSGIGGSGDVSNNSSVGGGLTGAALQDRLDHVPRPTTLSTRSNSSSTSTSASQSPSSAAASAAGRPFSREGIQQTIDGVKRRWFHGSDPEGDLIRATCQVVDEAETDGVLVSQLGNDMMQSCPPMMAAAAFGYAPRPGSSLGQEGPRNSPGLVELSRRLSETDGILGTSPSPAVASHRQVRELSQSPRQGGSPERRSSSFSGEQEEYDQSLDKLNKSLSELKGEIKRLSLQQQEQFRVAKPTVTGFESEEQQPPGYPPLATAPQLKQFPQQQSPLLTSHHGTRTVIGPVARTASHSHQPALPDPFSSPSLVPTAQPSPPPPGWLADLPPASGDGFEGVASQDDDSSSGNGGFFVVFGDESTPRRRRPKLGKEREGGGAIRKDSGGDERVPPTLAGGMVQAGAWAGSGELSSNHSGSHHSLGSDDSSQAATYVLGQETGPDGQGLQETEMQKKKKRLIEQQQKRKEEQERKRIEKEMEIQCKLEQKMQKEEEQARKKSEEKARKEAIFQQYMQKKMDGDEEKSPVSGPVTRRDRSAHGGQPRPKSMFVKNRPVVADVPDGAAANHSSQEDLALLKSPPSGAALSPFRLNPNSRGNIRKAVSTSQLAQNGGQGATTYRRPPSPGQGRRPPSPGPKLFVKPSAKSNRHIIINALSYCCLAGIVNNDLKNKVLEEIARSTAKHFLVLFRDHGCQYRGLYSFDPDSEEAYKITGVGPRLLASNMVERFYKYNSGGKSFTEVTSTKHLSVSIDAVVLMNTYWKTKPPSATASNVKK